MGRPLVEAWRPPGAPRNEKGRRSPDALCIRKYGGSGDGEVQVADAIDMAVQLVALLHPAHAGGRAGHNEIARRQTEQSGQVGDGLGHLPDELVEVALLAHLAVDLQPDRAGSRMADLARRHDLSARGGFLEGLADLPGAAEL